MAVLVVVLGFVPPLGWMVLVRSGDRHDREPLWGLLVAFLTGAFLVVAAVLAVGAPFAVVVPDVLYAVLVAPPLEEAAKLLGVLLLLGVLRRLVDEPADPVVYAATVGFGFAAAENVQYFTAVSDDGPLLVLLFVVRSVGTAVMHGVAAGHAGIALGRRRTGHPLGRTWRVGWWRAFLLHLGWNLLASIGGLFGLAAGVVLLVVATVAFLRGFRELVALSPHALHALPPPFRPRAGRD